MTDAQTVNSLAAHGSNVPIASFQVLHCGRAEQHREHRYGSRLPQLWWIFFGRSWVPLPLITRRLFRRPDSATVHGFDSQYCATAFFHHHSTRCDAKAYECSCRPISRQCDDWPVDASQISGDPHQPD